MNQTLTQIEEEELKRFDEEFPESKYFENHARLCFEGADNKVKSFLTQSNLRVIKKVKEMVEKEIEFWNKHSAGSYGGGALDALEKLKSDLSLIKQK